MAVRGRQMSRKRRRSPKYDKSVYRSIVLVTQFGINMLVPICMMSALGVWLDKRYHTSFWTILLFFVGAIAGAQNIYRMAKQVWESDGREGQEPVDEDKGHFEKKE